MPCNIEMRAHFGVVVSMIYDSNVRFYQSSGSKVFLSFFGHFYPEDHSWVMSDVLVQSP